MAAGAEVIAVTRSGKVGEYANPNLTVYQGDISSTESISKVAQQIEAAGIKLDVLVNNAGVGQDLGDEIPTADLLNATFATNTMGTVLFTEALLNSLNDGGQVVFLSTAMALLRNAAPNAPAYRMSKAALNMHAVMLSQRLAERKIRVPPLHLGGYRPGWGRYRTCYD